MLVDDHPLFLEGLQNLMQTQDIQVVGTARDGMEAVQKAETLQPDIILMDVVMPRCNGLTATRIIKAKFPDIKIVMLTSSESDQDLFEAVKSGACGYLLKNLNATELFNMLKSLQQGETPWSPGLAERILKEFENQEITDSDPGENFQLTERQMEVLKLVAQGMVYKEIGDRLGLSERTIKYHMAKIMEKLHLENRTQVIALASQLGMIG
jgi:two-component system NarL family response regulator